MTTALSRPRRNGGFLAALAVAVAAAIGIGAVATNSFAQSPDEYWTLPAAEFDPAESGTQTIVLAGGCFWGIQGVFQHVNGVTSAVSGYAGGSADTASYSRVLRGDTGHAESVRVTYNPSVVSLGEILQVFFSVGHNPMTLNRQGSDVGTMYRSHIYTTTAQQAEVTNAYIAQLDAAGVYSNPIVTQVDAAPTFYPAEAYHQDYLFDLGANDPGTPNVGYLRYWDLPKVANLQRVFPGLYRADPVLVAESNPDLAP